MNLSTPIYCFTRLLCSPIHHPTSYTLRAERSEEAEKKLQTPARKNTSTSNSPTFFKNVIKGESAGKDFRHMFSDQKTLETQKMLGALFDLLKIPRTQLMKYVTQHINLYDYLYTPRHEIYNTIKDKMGWEKTVDTFEHMDCQLHEPPILHPNTQNTPTHHRNTIQQRPHQTRTNDPG